VKRDRGGVADKRPRAGAGHCWPTSLVADALVAARPDEGETFSIFVIEQVGGDGRIERSIVEPERDMIAALVGALRAGGLDLGPAHMDPVAAGLSGKVCGPPIIATRAVVEVQVQLASIGTDLPISISLMLAAVISTEFGLSFTV
jgi:hypothetical protein